MGPVSVPEYDNTEVEAGEGHCFVIGKCLRILPETPQTVSIEDPLGPPEEEENSHPISRLHSHILLNLNSQVVNYNKKQESLFLELKPPGIYTITLKYLRK